MLDRTIFITLAGSHAHGTSGSHSDIDLRGVCIAPLPVRLSLYRRFEQLEGTLDGPLWDAVLPQLQAHQTARCSLGGKVETVIYDIAKFLELCARANPNALEILFAEKSAWLSSAEPWDQLYRERLRFLTKKLEATYSGYALGQLKKIRLHRGWLMNPPKAPPTREAYGLPKTSTLNRQDRERIERAVAERLRSYGIDDLELSKSARIQLAERMQRFMADVSSCAADALNDKLQAVATGSLPLPAALLPALEAERRYRAAQQHWESYRAWQRQRNPARAELERQYETRGAPATTLGNGPRSHRDW